MVKLLNYVNKFKRKLKKNSSALLREKDQDISVYRSQITIIITPF